MVLESTMICVDNSDFMRNGDFVPTRLQAQQDAVNLVCQCKTRANPENNVGLLTMAGKRIEVLNTLTSEAGRIMAKLHQVEPSGEVSFSSAVRVAHLALKHRQGKNHKMRIVCFVGSPIIEDDKDLVKLAKRLKKEKVSVDVVNFGEEGANTEKLNSFITTLNGKEGQTSHLVTVPPGPVLSDALVTSAVIQGEDSAGMAGMEGGGGSGGGFGGDFEFGVDPAADPELALALRVSMEEQRHRQEEEAKRNQQTAAPKEITIPEDNEEGDDEEALLAKALAMSIGVGDDCEDDSNSAHASSTVNVTAPTSGAFGNPSDAFGGVPDFATMTEDEQIAYAMRMSMQPGEEDDEMDAEPTSGAGAAAKEEDYSDVMTDPDFLHDVLTSLPGVDPQSDAIRQAVESLTANNESQKNDQDKDDDKKDKK